MHDIEHVYYSQHLNRLYERVLGDSGAPAGVETRRQRSDAADVVPMSS